MTAPPDLLIPPTPPVHPSPPTRKIYAEEDMQHWLNSEAYVAVEAFIATLRTASSHTAPKSQSKNAGLVSDLLKQLSESLRGEQNGNGVEQESNLDFQRWVDRAAETANLVHADLVDSAHSAALPELIFQFRSSFGSPERLDYGTGHELSFLAYLLILRLSGVLTAEDEATIAKVIFPVYFDLMKQVVKAFRLREAAKMGIWGVENGHLVYEWSASQKRIHPSKRPVSLLSTPSLSPQHISYLFLTTLLHINAGSTSPATSEGEDPGGLLRLYRSEVLHRLPVVQHLRFGSYFRWIRAGTDGSGEVLPSSGDGLDEDAKKQLDEMLNQRVTSEGTVAPWALPSLSGEKTPSEIFERLPSPARTPPPSASPEEQRRDSPPSPSSRTSPLPRPYSESPGGALGGRRMSRLSISESLDEQ
ncbi:phosphotyrosyl phosphatase activator [Rhodotorula toruloides]|uniref:Serine/threonine-protein phosphatase 2A activator n=1 Tax=Rhodotorula toruloides TaxID=5286 RepID=A0A511KE18_RHOTO|nr:phosphotyrosyl phosphatase activator [Rhodotorula toruloides]